MCKEQGQRGIGIILTEGFGQKAVNKKTCQKFQEEQAIRYEWFQQRNQMNGLFIWSCIYLAIFLMYLFFKNSRMRSSEQ